MGRSSKIMLVVGGAIVFQLAITVLASVLLGKLGYTAVSKWILPGASVVAFLLFITAWNMFIRK